MIVIFHNCDVSQSRCSFIKISERNSNYFFMEIIKGYVTNIIYSSEDGSYTVIELESEGNELTCVGAINIAGVGDMIECEGVMSAHSVYGPQFKVSSFRIIMPESTDQIEKYLAGGAVKGIGPSLAKRIVREFGEEAFRIIEEEPELLSRVRGISLNKAREIAVSMQEKKAERAPLIFMQEYGINGSLANRLVKKYGDKIYSVLKEDPYKLADEIDGVGFKRADEIAFRGGFAADSEYRIKGGILYTLLLAGREGHCCLPADILCRSVRKLLCIDIDDEALEGFLHELQASGKIRCIMPDNDADEKSLSSSTVRIYDVRTYIAEHQSAQLLGRYADTFAYYRDEEGHKEDEARLDEEIREAERALDISLDKMQRLAVVQSITDGVVIITGGPGTGKTTAINCILRLFFERGMEVALAAPTGRAAKRMKEATGHEASTLHRLLEVEAIDTGDGELRARFTKNENNPLEYDAVIVDEMSMVDIYLFYALLKACTAGMRLIFVGDASQLSSVGAGQVLRDLIASKRFSTVVLDKIFRQEEASDIVINAHSIDKGERINLGSGGKDFFFMERTDAMSATGTIVQLVRDKLPPYLEVSPDQIQVLTPMKKGDLGVHALNNVLQTYLNPGDDSKKEQIFGDRVFREGDKVMQIKNNYNIEWECIGLHNLVIERGKGVFNGDLGVIKRIDKMSGCISVEFDDSRLVSYSFKEADELELAYAVTIHKSQGSEYPAVVLPLVGGPKPLMNRNLLYTAVTRAKRLVVIVGDKETVNEMIANKDQSERYTGLREQIALLN